MDDGDSRTGQSYRERRPLPPMRRLLAAVWVQRVGDRAPAYTNRSLPNGSVELHCPVGSTPRLVGAVSGATTYVLAPGTTLVGVRFRPAAATAFRVPSAALVDDAVDARDIWGDLADELGARVAAAPSPDVATTLIQRALQTRLHTGATDELVTEAVRRLMPWHDTDVRTLAVDLGVSDRQLRRRCRDAVGMSPKELHRALRFQGFLALAQHALGSGLAPAPDGLAALATDAGYTDQAHLNHECRRLTGVTPRVFLDETTRSCGCGHDHAASYAPLLRHRTDVRSLQEGCTVPA